MHLITTSEIGGAEIQLERLLAHMDHPSLRHCVVSMARPGVIAEKIRSRGIQVYSLNINRGALSVSSVSGLLKLVGLVRSERPAIIQSWMYHASLLGVLVGKLMGISLVFWNIRCAEMDMAHYPKLTKLVIQTLRHMSRLPQLVIVNSEAGRLAHIRKGFSPEIFQVIPNGFELDRFRPDDSAREWFLQEFGVARDAVIVGLVARYDPMKDHKMFLAAISQVHAVHPMAVFVLCGKDVDEGNSVLSNLIQSSVRRGRRGGVPCVVTDVGDSGLIVGSTGRVVPAGEADVFAQALSELIACGRMARKHLGEQARTRIAELFDINRVADRYREIYLACH